jgi:hypothetical protein
MNDPKKENNIPKWNKDCRFSVTTGLLLIISNGNENFCFPASRPLPSAISFSASDQKLKSASADFIRILSIAGILGVDFWMYIFCAERFDHHQKCKYVKALIADSFVRE